MPTWFNNFRLKFFSVLALVLVAVVFVLAPAQLPVVLHKFSLVTLAAVLGYWLDRHLFPYARPDSFLPGDLKSMGEAALRRAIIVGAVVVGVALAL